MLKQPVEGQGLYKTVSAHRTPEKLGVLGGTQPPHTPSRAPLAALPQCIQRHACRLAHACSGSPGTQN